MFSAFSQKEFIEYIVCARYWAKPWKGSGEKGKGEARGSVGEIKR